MKFFAKFALFALLFVAAPHLHAQTGSVAEIIEQGITLSIIPAHPGPGETATARLESSTVNINLSKITWSVNGAQRESGLGRKTFEFITGSSGTKTTVSAKIEADAGTFTQSTILDNGSVDLLWKGGGYTPPFYEGRTLWGRQTRITFLAVPHVSSGRVVYQWSLNRDVLAASSGANQNYFIYTDSILGIAQTIKVEILASDGSVLAANEVTLTPVDQFINVYENNPLIGFKFHHEVDGIYLLLDKEVTFAAFPFFFGVGSRAQNSIGFVWATNAGPEQHTDTVVYRAPESGEGSASVDVQVTNPSQILQSAGKSFLVQFSN